MTDTVIEMFDTESDVDDGDDGAAGEKQRGSCNTVIKVSRTCWTGIKILPGSSS